jgi:uncharacterized membrane protein
MDASEQAAAGPPDQSQASTGFDMETLIGYLLLIGVLISLGLIVAGTFWHWCAQGNLRFAYSIQGTNLFGFLAGSLWEVPEGTWRPRVLINLGLSALLLTPYLRVLASMLYFLFARRNWKYTLFTLFVFAVLTYTLFLR